MHIKLSNLTVFVTVKNEKQVKTSKLSEWLWFINLMKYYERVIKIDYVII